MSSLSNLPGRIEEVQRLPQPLDHSRVFVVPITSLFPGNGIGPARRALERGYFDDLRAFLANDSVLREAISAAGYAAGQAIAILTNQEGDVVVFVDG